MLKSHFQNKKIKNKNIPIIWHCKSVIFGKLIILSRNKILVWIQFIICSWLQSRPPHLQFWLLPVWPFVNIIMLTSYVNGSVTLHWLCDRLKLLLMAAKPPKSQKIIFEHGVLYRSDTYRKEWSNAYYPWPHGFYGPVGKADRNQVIKGKYDVGCNRILG